MLSRNEKSSYSTVLFLFNRSVPGVRDGHFFLVIIGGIIRAIFQGMGANPIPFRAILLGVLAALLGIYVVFGAFIWWTMHRPPEDIGRVMARIPGPVVFLLYPFETFWLHARAGTLNVGDRAPDFSLAKVDKSGSIQLSELNHQGPVALIFGSYT